MKYWAFRTVTKMSCNQSFVSQRLAEGERIYEADNQFRAASSGPADAVVSPDDSMFGTVPKEPETNDLEYD